MSLEMAGVLGSNFGGSVDIFFGLSFGDKGITGAFLSGRGGGISPLGSGGFSSDTVIFDSIQFLAFVELPFLVSLTN